MPIGKVALCLTASLFLLHGGSLVAHSADALPQHTVGQFKIVGLNEAENQGNPSLLINADSTLVEKYIPEGTYPTAINIFLIQTPDHNILVDTGFGRSLPDQFSTLGLKHEDIDSILITHMHGDHIGGLLDDGNMVFPNAQIYIAEKEMAYWTDKTAMDALPEDKRSGFHAAQQVIDLYGDKVHAFTPGELGSNGADVVPGIQAWAAYGHTPGHTAFLVHSGNDRMLMWGDLTHAMAIQMPHPSVALVYDVDPQMAVATREAYLKYVAQQNLPVAGAHVPKPGMGTVSAIGDNSYEYASY